MRKLFKILKRDVTLTESERTVMRQSVVAFMRENPLRNDRVPHRIRFAGIFTQHAFFLRYNFLLVSVLALIFIGVGTSWAAERALPGDLLYPVKIGINENIRTVLARTPEERAQWSSQQAVRRLNEGEQLAVQGRLDAQAKAEVARGFAASARKISADTAQLAAHGDTRHAAEVNSHFEATLRAHQQILNELEQRPAHPAEQAQVSDLIRNVNAALQGTEDSRKKSEAEVASGAASSVKAAAEDTLQEAEHKVSEVRTLLGPRLRAMDNAAQEDTRAKVSAAQETITKGKKNFAEGDFGRAFAQFQEAQRLVQETKTLVQGRDQLGIRQSASDSHKKSDEKNRRSPEGNKEQWSDVTASSTDETVDGTHPTSTPATSTLEIDRDSRKGSDQRLQPRADQESNGAGRMQRSGSDKGKKVVKI